MSNLISPHGSDELKILLLEGKEREEELKKAETLPKVVLTSREVGDLIMMGIGGFTPLEGFMGHDDWKGVCEEMKMASGIFWPIPITMSHDEKIEPGTEICLVSGDTNEIMGTMKVTESYKIDKEFVLITGPKIVTNVRQAYTAPFHRIVKRKFTARNATMRRFIEEVPV